MVTHLPIFTFLTGEELIRWIHEIVYVSGKAWDNVAKLEAKHDQPTLHICNEKYIEKEFKLKLSGFAIKRAIN